MWIKIKQNGKIGFAFAHNSPGNSYKWETIQFLVRALDIGAVASNKQISKDLVSEKFFDTQHKLGVT